ncbi:hypothetical protein [Streptomyces sp. KR55]
MAHVVDGNTEVRRLDLTELIDLPDPLGLSRLLLVGHRVAGEV